MLEIILKRPDLYEQSKELFTSEDQAYLNIVVPILLKNKGQLTEKSLQIIKDESVRSKWAEALKATDVDVSVLIEAIKSQQEIEYRTALQEHLFDDNLDVAALEKKYKTFQEVAQKTNITVTTDQDEIFHNLEELEKGESRIPTGFSQLDNILVDPQGSGWIKGYTYCVQGLTGTNKTFILINWAVKQLLADKKVLYISSEMNAKQIHSRLYKALFIESSVDAIKTKMKLHKTSIQLAVIEYGRSSASTDTIRSDIDKLPWKPDIIVCDYLDVLLPTRKYQQSWEAQAIVSDDLCNLAKELDLPLLTASQTNRTAAHDKMKGTKDFQGYESVGSSYGKTHQFAGLWSIRTNENDYDAVSKVRKLDLLCNKNRDGEESNSSYYLDYNTCKLYEAGEIVNHSDAKEDAVFKAAERIKVRKGSEPIDDENINKLNKYFENLKDMTDIKQIKEELKALVQKREIDTSEMKTLAKMLADKKGVRK